MTGNTDILDHSAVGAPLKVRLRRAVPSPRTALAGALLWGLTISLSAYLGIAHWANPHHAALVVLLFGIGAALAFPAALFLSRLVAENKAPSGRFAAAFVMLALGTIAVTAILFALDYRIYYAAWHEEPFTRGWFVQFAFTVAGALYQFAVIGLRLYFPVGFAALFAASLWFALRAR